MGLGFIQISQEMRCIFCKADSSNSKSVEHIIPESLGNKEHILQKGVVCDKCNNYFSHKIEKPVLEMPYFHSLRSRKLIENKKGKIPRISGFTKENDEIEIVFLKNRKNTELVYKDDLTLKNLLKSNEFYIPFIPEPPRNDVRLSKFIGKIALEALSERVLCLEEWQNDFVENVGLDDLRDFVRFGKVYTIWPYHIRRIDNENQIKYHKLSNNYCEVLNEYDFLIPDKPKDEKEMCSIGNLYFVMSIMGVEYTINLTNAGLDRYIKWLSENQNRTILQMEKIEFKYFLS